MDQQPGRVGQEYAGAPNLRKLDELPYQQTMGNLGDDLYATVSDFRFLDVKVASLGAIECAGADGQVTKVHAVVYLLQADFALALERMPKE